jgi:hypothetical protein
MFVQLVGAGLAPPDVGRHPASYSRRCQKTVIPTEAGRLFLSRSLPVNASAREVEGSLLDVTNEEHHPPITSIQSSE